MIKAEVRYTLEHFKAMQLDPFSLKTKALWIIIAVLSTCLAVRYIANGYYFNLFTILAVIIWFFCILYTIYYKVVWSPKRMMKKLNKVRQDVPVCVEFHENGMKMTYKFPDSEGYIESNFDDIDIAWEKNDFFVLNSKKSGLLPIKKSEITEGTPDELRQLLKDKLGSRFSQKGTSKW